MILTLCANRGRRPARVRGGRRPVALLIKLEEHVLISPYRWRPLDY